MIETLYDTNRQAFIRKYYKKHNLSTTEYDRNTLLLTIYSEFSYENVQKPYVIGRNRGKKRNIVAPRHSSRYNVIC